MPGIGGKPLLSLDIGLPVTQLVGPIRGCLRGEREAEELAIDATNCRGRPVRCQVSLSVLAGPRGERRGVIVVVEEKAAADRPADR
jgi:hypothetical protein